MSAPREKHKSDLLGFLRTIQKAGLPVESLGERDRLVASGLIDSLAYHTAGGAACIVTYLEATHGIDFAVRGVDPDQLSSIGNILDLIEQKS